MPELMLAVPHGSLDPDPVAVIRKLMVSKSWTYEYKIDGIRAVVHVKDGEVRITNRRSADITFRYPEVVDALTGFTPDVVLDGEIACMDANGRPDFSKIHRRDAQGSARSARQLVASLPAQFVAFDVLEVDGENQRGLSYQMRRARLVSLGARLTPLGVVVPPVSQDGLTAWQVVCDLGLEGLVAKRNDAPYVGRRSPAWVKLKRTHRVSVLVSGFDAGEGSRARTFGALLVSLLDERGALVPVGSVGSGFTEADIATIWGRLERGDHPIIVDVDYLEVSPAGQLRQPVFKGTRSDLDPLECTMTQLEGTR